jgi:hypothetical protein
MLIAIHRTSSFVRTFACRASRGVFFGQSRRRREKKALNRLSIGRSLRRSIKGGPGWSVAALRAMRRRDRRRSRGRMMNATTALKSAKKITMKTVSTRVPSEGSARAFISSIFAFRVESPSTGRRASSPAAPRPRCRGSRCTRAPARWRPGRHSRPVSGQHARVRGSGSGLTNPRSSPLALGQAYPRHFRQLHQW